MRTALSLTMIIAAMTVIAATSSVATSGNWGQWQNSLKPKGEPGAEIALAVGGETEYVVVVPENATTQEQKAAEDLAYWLEEMTGATFPVVSDADAPRQKEISVGRTNRLTQASLAVARDDLSDEGYGIAVQGERLFLLGGKKRGPINAVYAFLEEDLGCRWYTAKVSRILRRPTVKVKVMPRSYVPALEFYRSPGYCGGDPSWSLRNRKNAFSPIPEEWGGSINYAQPGHTFNILVPSSQYFEEHPEYYSLIDGKRVPRQLCLTNPEVVKIATESTLRILRERRKERPNSELFRVSQNDGRGYCTCDKCKALDEAEESHAGTLIHFVNQVAEIVGQKYPKVIVETFAYLHTAKPPRTIRPRENVAIVLCTDCCMWPHPFTPAEENEEFRNMLLGWAKIHDRIHLYDYPINYSHYQAPMPNMETIASNIRFFAKHGATAIQECSNSRGAGSERHLMRAWVLAKLMWDPSRDVWNLMQDFIWGYYGKAAPAIAEYNELLRRTAEAHKESMRSPSHGIRYPMNSEFLSPDFLEQATAIFDRAERLAENEEILHQVELARLPIMYVKLCRGPEFVGEDEDYLSLLDRFETIARREGVTHLREGPPDLDEKLQGWRDMVRVKNELGKLNIR